MLVGARDRIRRYVLVANSHDGSTALTVKFVLERVVCFNTWTVALGEDGAEIRIRHTVGATSERTVNEAKRVLGIADRVFAEFEADAAVLCQLTFTPEDMRALAHYLIPPTPVAEDVDSEKLVLIGESGEGVKEAYTKAKAALVDWLVGAMDKAPGNEIDGVRGTAWAAFNAVTYWTSHFRDTRVSSRRAAGGLKRDDLVREARLDSLWFGEGQKLNDRALVYLRGQADLAGIERPSAPEDEEHLDLGLDS